MEEQQMPAAAHRRRAGVFARLLTVRSFRGQRRQAAGPSRADQVVDSLLEAATAQGVLTLHHRRVPGRRGRVEHIAVGASGVYVIDVRHGGNASVEVHRVGDAPADDTLVVGGRDLTPAVVATAGRVAALRALLADVGLDDVPVNGALCVVEGLMPPSRDTLEVAGVHVVQPGDLAAQVTAPGAFSADDRETLRELLARELPPSA